MCGSWCEWCWPQLRHTRGRLVFRLCRDSMIREKLCWHRLIDNFDTGVPYGYSDAWSVRNKRSVGPIKAGYSLWAELTCSKTCCQPAALVLLAAATCIRWLGLVGPLINRQVDQQQSQQPPNSWQLHYVGFLSSCFALGQILWLWPRYCSYFRNIMVFWISGICLLVGGKLIILKNG